MREFSRISGLAILLIVGLRVAIGWQLLYEGLWKVDSHNSARPWTAAGYLRNARGPFRDHFRNLAGDPDDLNWLDPDKVAARWDNWFEDFKAHYSGLPDEELQLTEEQARAIDRALNGDATYAAVLKKLPPGIRMHRNPEEAREKEKRELQVFDPRQVLFFDPDRGRLMVYANVRMTPREKTYWLGQAAEIKNPTPEQAEENKLRAEFRNAVETAYARQARLSFKERMRAELAGNPDVRGVAVVIEETEPLKYEVTMAGSEGENEVVERRKGKIELYQRKLRLYEVTLEKAQTEFQHEHLEKQWNEIQQMRAELVNPIKALEDEFLEFAQKQLTTAQLTAPPVGEPPKSTDNVDTLTIVSLTGLGVLLMTGLLTRVAAVLAAGMLLNFYLVIPPWPGVPQPPSPEHSLFVNKNMVEVVALLAIAALPTGQWFGLDRLVTWCLRKAFHR